MKACLATQRTTGCSTPGRTTARSSSTLPAARPSGMSQCTVTPRMGQSRGPTCMTLPCSSSLWPSCSTTRASTRLPCAGGWRSATVARMEQGKTNIKLLQLSAHRNLRQRSMPMHQQLRHPQPNHPRLRQSLRSNGPRMRQKLKSMPPSCESPLSPSRQMLRQSPGQRQPLRQQPRHLHQKLHPKLRQSWQLGRLRRQCNRPKLIQPTKSLKLGQHRDPACPPH